MYCFTALSAKVKEYLQVIVFNFKFNLNIPSQTFLICGCKRIHSEERFGKPATSPKNLFISPAGPAALVWWLPSQGRWPEPGAPTYWSADHPLDQSNHCLAGHVTPLQSIGGSRWRWSGGFVSSPTPPDSPDLKEKAREIRFALIQVIHYTQCFSGVLSTWNFFRETLCYAEFCIRTLWIILEKHTEIFSRDEQGCTGDA